MTQLILASSSVYRKALLERLGLAFDSASPNVDETYVEGETPAEMVMRLAKDKAHALGNDNPHALIIGSDQCAVLDETILGKPENFRTAFNQLKQAVGRTVVFHTGLCLLNTQTGYYQLDNVESRVRFRLLTDAQITCYLEKEQPYDCTGSFRAEALGIALFEHIQSDDPSALIGLPLIRLTAMLAQEGLDVLS